MSFSSDIPLLANQLAISIDFPETDDPNFLNELSLAYKRIADVSNTKEGALYLLQELATFQLYFTTGDPTQLKNTYRFSYDLVDIFGAPIPVGTTVIPLTGSNIINGILIPTRGTITATIAGPIYVFWKDVTVRFDNTVPTAQTIIVTNNTGSVLTQCYFTIEYTKN